MSSKATLGLVACFLILGSYIYFFELSEDTADEKIASNIIPLYEQSYGEYDIVTMEIVTAQGTSRFVRTDKTHTQEWQLASPQTLPPENLDQVRINGAATRLGRLTASQMISQVTNLSAYGLDPPTLTVTLTISNGQTITLWAGNPTPVNDQHYLQWPTSPQLVYLVPDLAISELHNLIVSPPLAPTPLPTITPRPTP